MKQSSLFRTISFVLAFLMCITSSFCVYAENNSPIEQIVNEESQDNSSSTSSSTMRFGNIRPVSKEERRAVLEANKQEALELISNENSENIIYRLSEKQALEDCTSEDFSDIAAFAGTDPTSTETMLEEIMSESDCTLVDCICILKAMVSLELAFEEAEELFYGYDSYITFLDELENGTLGNVQLFSEDSDIDEFSGDHIFSDITPAYYASRYSGVSVSLSTGALSYRETLAQIPSIGSLPDALSIVYDSDSAGLGETNIEGEIGYTGNDYIDENGNTVVGTYIYASVSEKRREEKYSPAIGWKYDLPYVDSGYIHIPGYGSGMWYNNDGIFEVKGNMFDVSTVGLPSHVNSQSCRASVTTNDGTVFYFNKKGLILQTIDRFGNSVNYFYNDDYGLSRIVGPDSSEISITRETNDQGYLYTISYPENGKTEIQTVLSTNTSRYDYNHHQIQSISHYSTDNQCQTTIFDYTKTETYMDINSVEDIRCNDSVLLTTIHYPQGSKTDFTYAPVEIHVADTMGRTFHRVVNETFSNGMFSDNNKEYVYEGNHTGFTDGMVLTELTAQTSFSYSVTVVSEGRQGVKKHSFLVENAVRDYPLYTFEPLMEHTVSETSFSSYNAITNVGVPYLTQTVEYGDNMNTPLETTTTYHGFSPAVSVSSSNEYDENDRLTMSHSARADGDTTDLHKTFYTYDATYSLPTEIRYKTDANTTVRVVNTLSDDKKNITRTQTFVNNIEKERTDYTYFSNGNVKSKKVWTDIATNKYVVTNYTYNGNTNLVSTVSMPVTDIDGDAYNRTASYTYYDSGAVETFTNPNGYTTTYYVDALGRTLGVYENHSGRMLNYTYNDSANTTSYQTFDGAVITAYYNENGNLIRQTSSHGGETATMYDADMLYNDGTPYISYMTNSDGDEWWTYEGYDYIGRYLGGDIVTFEPDWKTEKSWQNTYTDEMLTIDGEQIPAFVTVSSVENTAKQRTATNKFGDTILEASVHGDDNTYGAVYSEYDDFGRLTRKYYLDGGYQITIATYEYDYAGRVIRETNTDGNSRTFTYDAIGRLLSESDFAGNVTTYTYDQAGRLIKQEMPFEGSYNTVKEMQYDGVGNLTLERISSGTPGGEQQWKTSTYEYDSSNNLTKAYDGRAYSYYFYNDADRLTSTCVSPYDYMSDAALLVASYTYDGFGNLTSLTDAEGNNEFYDYDGYGVLQRKSENPFEDGEYDYFEYDYDIFGNLISEFFRTGETTATEGIFYEYDTLGNVTKTSTGTTSASATESTFVYDDLNRVTSETINLGGKTAVKSYAYDQFGNETSFTLALDGVNKITKTSGYDSMLRLNSVTQGANAVSYTYDTNGRLATTTNGNAVTTYQKNKAGLVTNLEISRGIFEDEYTYEYSLDGNQISKTNHSAETITEYTYDLQGQLTSENTRFYNYEYMAPNTDVYWYDYMGNRTLKTEYRRNEENPSEQTAKFIRSTYNKANQLIESYDSETDTETTFTYDSRGNLLTDGNSTRTYNNRNRQISYSDGETTTNYTYYVDGLRKSKEIGNSETQYFIWHNGNMVYEFTSEDANTYAYGLGIFASDDARYLLNAHGDVIYTINAQGNTIYWYDYDAFGNQLNYLYPEDTNPFRYCGEYYDTETGTIYLRARYYSPVNGRFTTKDPHWNVNNMIYGDPLEDNPNIRVPDYLAIKQSANLYVYCLNNPVIFIDESGNVSIIATIAIGAGVGALVSAGFQIFKNITNGEKWTTNLGTAFLSGAASGAISVIPIPGVSKWVAVSITGATGNLVGQTIVGEIDSGEDVVNALVAGVSAGIVGEASARVLSAGFQKYFSTLTKVQQKEMLSKIGNITNRELKAIRQEISNGLTNDKLLELVETYGYDVIVSALVSSTTASAVQ